MTSARTPRNRWTIPISRARWRNESPPGRIRWESLVCGTGIGVSIAANKVEGIRAALAHDSLTARRAREHNDANVLALGGKVVGEDEAIAIVQEFLSAQFAGGRHQRRIDKINEMDQVREHKS